MGSAKLNVKESSTAPGAAPSPDIGKPDVGQDVTAFDDSAVENGTVVEAGLLEIFSKPQIALIWAGLLVMVLMNYLNTSTLFTFSVYALSDFSQAASEGTLNTIFGIVALGKILSLYAEYHSSGLINHQQLSRYLWPWLSTTSSNLLPPPPTFSKLFY